MFTLRQKLQAYFGTDLPQVPNLYTQSPGANMNDSQYCTTTNQFQSHSSPTHTGSPKKSKRIKQKQSGPTSHDSAATTLTLASQSQSLMMSESNACYKDP